MVVLGQEIPEQIIRVFAVNLSEHDTLLYKNYKPPWREVTKMAMQLWKPTTCLKWFLRLSSH